MKKFRNTYLFMRHEESVSNQRMIVSGNLHKNPLTPDGRADAGRASKFIKRRFPPDIIYTSPLKRAYETASIVGHACRAPVKIMKEFRELNFGRFEGQPVSVYQAAFKNNKQPFTDPVGHAETRNHIRRRVAAGFKKIEKKHKGKKILIVSHGDPLWMLASWLLKLSTNQSLRFAHHNYMAVGEVRRIIESERGFWFKKIFPKLRQRLK